MERIQLRFEKVERGDIVQRPVNKGTGFLSVKAPGAGVLITDADDRSRYVRRDQLLAFISSGEQEMIVNPWEEATEAVRVPPTGSGNSE